MLTFLALAANKGFVVESHEDAAVGYLSGRTMEFAGNARCVSGC